MQLKKNQQIRKNQRALKIVEKEKCKQPGRFHLSNTISEDGFSPPDGLVFHFEHYGVPRDSNRPPVFTDFVEHIDSASVDEEGGSTEPRPSVGSSSISQVEDNSIDERLVSNEGTDTSLQVEGEDELTDGSLEIATSFSESGSIQENEVNFDKHSSINTNSLVMSEHVPNDQAKESITLTQCSVENGRSPSQVKEGTTLGSIDFHRDKSLSHGSETKGRGNPASTDDRNGKAVAASISGDKDAKDEPHLADAKIVNRSIKHHETSIIHELTEQGSNENYHAEENGEIPAQTECVEGSSNDVVSSSAPDETPSDKAKYTGKSATAGQEETTEIHETFPDQWTDGRDSCVPVDIHQCDFTTVGSPRVLELVLKVCSGHRVNEEEVGEANTFSRICLSGWHLRCENGLWFVVERGETHSGRDPLSSDVKIQLSGGLEALFHKDEKLWTVLENAHVINKPEVIKNQSVHDNDTFAVAEDSSNDVASKDRPVTPDLSPVQSKLPAIHAPVPSSRAESSNQEVLHAGIQRIFQHMIEFGGSAEEALVNREHENITESICKSLCSALWNILSVGVRKRFLVKYTVWNVVEEFKDVSSLVRRTVDWVNTRYASLGEPQKFQAFVCECLNIGQGTLHQWLERLLRQNKKRLEKYYSKDGIVFHPSREKLEELVLDLSRISSLTFELHFESWIKMQGYGLNEAAFTFE